MSSVRSLALLIVGCLALGMMANLVLWSAPAARNAAGVSSGGVTSPPAVALAAVGTCSPTIAKASLDPEEEVGNHAGPKDDLLGSIASRTPTNRVKVTAPNGDDDDEAEVDFSLLTNSDESLSSVFRGVRTFEGQCLFPEVDRLGIFPKAKAIEKVQSRRSKKSLTGDVSIVSLTGNSFVIRDVCALGHFPKDLAHYHSWEEEEKAKTEGVTQGSSPLRYTILGHRCVSKDPSKITNKRTPVFRDVLRHWVDAIVGRPVLNDSSTPATDILLSAESDSAQSQRRHYIFYEDVVELIDNGDSNKKPTLLCFDRILERHETWRWFPSQSAAHSFRKKLWKHFGLTAEAKTLREELLHLPFDKQRKLQVLVLRRDEDRHFNELKTSQFLQSKFGKVANIVYTQFDKPPAKNLRPENDIDVPSFAEQVRALFFTDVLIAAHGAALSSVVFMRPGTVVLELFPHNFRYYMYEELCIAMGLRYTPVEGSVVAPAKCCRGRTAAATTADLPDDQQSVVLKTAGELQASKLPVAEIGFQSIKELNGLRECKKCDIAVSNSEWYYLTKNALATVWLRNSRLSDVHHFDIRR